MKPAPFAYDAARSVEEALALLAEYGDEARVIAGGQSLVPMMNFRLARPGRLIDLNAMSDLRYVNEGPDGFSVGAMTRQRHLEQSTQVRERCELLALALPWIGHVQIRNRGTIGGSLSHADPAAELPVVARALNARIRVASASNERWIDASDFFVGYFTTALSADELLVDIHFPYVAPHIGVAFTEFARRHGDFGLGGAAVVIELDSDGICTQARIVLLGAGSTPERAADAEAMLSGRLIDDEALGDVAARIESSIDPPADDHGSTGYRRRLIANMARTAVAQATAKATVAA